MAEAAQSVTGKRGLDGGGVSAVKDICVSHGLPPFYIHYLPKRSLVENLYATDVVS